MNIDSSSSAPLSSYLQQAAQSQQATKAAETETPSSAAPGASTSGLRVSDLERIQSYVDKLKEMPDIREEKVTQAKAALEAGDYDSPEVLDEVVSRLIEDI